MTEKYIKAHEYESNVNPKLKSIPIFAKNIDECDYGITHIHFDDIYNVKYKLTTPNLLASFIKLRQLDYLIEISQENLNMNASSHFFYIMQGNTEFLIDGKSYFLSSGDIFIHPLLNSIQIINKKTEELYIYYINDSPLLNYSGTQPCRKIFQPAIYSKEFIENSIQELANPNNNRKGILLSNTDTELIGVNTITPILWALYNELPANTFQKPHRHNSVALDLCIKCSDYDNIYTLIGHTLDENGKILNPQKVNWDENGMFVTPPGLWHSHHNDGNTVAYVLPIQDAGLLLYQRILGIELT
jgi:gentisate 1,2-dioxygenase